MIELTDGKIKVYVEETYEQACKQVKRSIKIGQPMYVAGYLNSMKTNEVMAFFRPDSNLLVIDPVSIEKHNLDGD